MELISAIAILSIVAIAAFTLLIFSINSNNLILPGASASQDAELLNKLTQLSFDLLKDHPNGLRLRSIGAKLGVWHPSLAKDMAELERKGQIIGILRREGYTVRNSDFFKIGIPFTFAAVISAYVYPCSE